jgi:hypothetical protein
LDSRWKFKTARAVFSRCWYSNSSFSFWWYDTPATGATEEYDGTSWTAGGSLNTARIYLAGCGTQTAALAFGGQIPTVTGATEEYDGSTWTKSYKFKYSKKDYVSRLQEHKQQH